MRSSLGSVVALSNANSEVVETYSYDVFGQPTIRNANDNIIADSNFGNPYMFTSRRIDPETDNYYYRARFYKPSIGRFLQPDPIGYSDGLNMYAYCINNPTNWIDPWGLDTYRQKRKIGDSETLPIGEIVSHEFVFTTTLSGDIENTYSWGNTYRREYLGQLRKQGQWRMDMPEDIAAAKAGLADGTAFRVGDSSLDPYVRKAYYHKVINDNPHAWWLWNMCQTEARELLELSKQLAGRKNEPWWKDVDAVKTKGNNYE